MTSSRQSLPTTAVFDYLMKAGDATATTPSPLTGAEVRITLQYDRATTPSPLTYVAPQTVVVTTDSNGYWTANLVPNSGTSGLSPSNTLYTVQTPYSVYQISVPTTGGPYQSSSIVANGLSALAAATTNLTGPLTVAGLLTAQAGENLTGALTMADAASRLVPGATSFSVRDTANANDNLLVSNAGAATVRNGLTVTAGGLTVTSGGETITAGDLAVTAGRVVLGAAAAKIVPGATSLSLRNNADGADNLLISDAGVVTVRNNIVGAPNLPLGTIAYAQVLADQAALSAITDLTGLTVTFTAVAGRRYRVTGKIEVTASVADGAYVLTLADGANTALQRATDGCLTTAARSVNLAYVEVPGGGSITRKLRLSKAGGTGTLTAPYGGGPAFILVEDIGT